MKILKNWLNEFIDISNVSAEKLCQTLNSIGLEVDACTQVQMPEHVVVGKIIECEKHPDAEKLNVCKVDVGQEEPLQIVCGAKNARAGIFTAVALVGAQIGEIKIKKAKLRGVESCGMCCSSVELGIAKINDGIIELDSSVGELIPGTPLKDIDAFNDVLIEIELTANRGDCLSLNGVARDLSAALDVNLKQKKEFIDNDNAMGIRRLVGMHYADTLNSHFCLKAAIDEENHFAAPLLINLRLAMIDKLCNSDIQNHLTYASHATGVILVGIDIDKLAVDAEQYTLQIKPLENGESEISFNGERVGIACVECEEKFLAQQDCKRLLIMAQYTHPDVIAQCHKNYKNADVYHSFRGSEPELELGLNYLCNHLNAHVLAGTSQNAKLREKISVSFSIGELEKLIGQPCEKNDVVKILKRLGFELSIAEDNICAKVPHFRHDISNSADICEEIVRIIGIDNITTRPLEFVEANRTNEVLKNYHLAKKMREKAVVRGYFESVGYVFESKDFLQLLGLQSSTHELVNPISEQMNVLRPMVCTSLLHHARGNFANGKKCVKLFEIGEVFSGSVQFRRLCMLAAGQVAAASIKNGAKPKDVDFFSFLSDVQAVIGAFSLEKSENELFSEYERAKVYKNGTCVGEVGRLALAIEDELEIGKTYIFEGDFSALKEKFIVAKEYSKMPRTFRDLSIIVPQNFDYEKIKGCINNLKIPTLKNFHLVDLYRDESLAGKESLTINFEFGDNQKALKNEDVNGEMQEILSKLLELGLQAR